MEPSSFSLGFYDHEQEHLRQLSAPRVLRRAEFLPSPAFRETLSRKQPGPTPHQKVICMKLWLRFTSSVDSTGYADRQVFRSALLETVMSPKSVSRILLTSRMKALRADSSANPPRVVRSERSGTGAGPLLTSTSWKFPADLPILLNEFVMRSFSMRRPSDMMCGHVGSKREIHGMPRALFDGDADSIMGPLIAH